MLFVYFQYSVVKCTDLKSFAILIHLHTYDEDIDIL